MHILASKFWKILGHDVTPKGKSTDRQSVQIQENVRMFLWSEWTLTLK